MDPMTGQAVEVSNSDQDFGRCTWKWQCAPADDAFAEKGCHGHEALLVRLQVVASLLEQRQRARVDALAAV